MLQVQDDNENVVQRVDGDDDAESTQQVHAGEIDARDRVEHEQAGLYRFARPEVVERKSDRRDRDGNGRPPKR